MELEMELEVSYNDKRCLVERVERRIGATDGTDGDRAVGRGVSVDRHSHARSPYLGTAVRMKVRMYGLRDSTATLQLPFQTRASRRRGDFHGSGCG